VRRYRAFACLAAGHACDGLSARCCSLIAAVCVCFVRHACRASMPAMAIAPLWACLLFLHSAVPCHHARCLSARLSSGTPRPLASRSRLVRALTGCQLYCACIRLCRVRSAGWSAAQTALVMLFCAAQNHVIRVQRSPPLTHV
jgi:hypothetical protein